MIPAPGFQNPMPYFAETEDRKSKTSLFGLAGCIKVALRTDFRLDEVIAMHG